MIFATWTSLFNNSVSKKCTFVLGDFTLWQFNNRKRGELFQCVFKCLRQCLKAYVRKCSTSYHLVSMRKDHSWWMSARLMHGCLTNWKVMKRKRTNIKITIIYRVSFMKNKHVLGNMSWEGCRHRSQRINSLM